MTVPLTFLFTLAAFSLSCRAGADDDTRASSHAAWDRNTSFRQLGFAQATYCLEGHDKWNCGAVCNNLPYLNDLAVVTTDSTRGLAYVGWHEQEEDGIPVIEIAFRGTRSQYFQNWWSDLSSLQLKNTSYCPLPECKVGRGFLTAYEGLLEQGLLDQILQINMTAMNASKQHGIAPRVRITGHSLGASLASVCAIHLYQRGVFLDSVVTFGSPRTGNSIFAEWYQRVIYNFTRYAYRVTHYRDPIIHLPPYGISGLDFHHVARETFFKTENGDAHVVCDGSGEDHSCSLGWTPLPSPRDHLNYMGMKLGSDECPAGVQELQ